MSEPPPSPLETSASIPRKPQKLYNPCSPSLGSQKFLLMRYGLRGNEPGGYGFPLSRRQTRRPASASRYAITDPPNPDPMITAWKCVSSILVPHISWFAFFLRPPRTSCPHLLGGGPCLCVHRKDRDDLAMNSWRSVDGVGQRSLTN